MMKKYRTKVLVTALVACTASLFGVMPQSMEDFFDANAMEGELLNEWRWKSDRLSSYYTYELEGGGKAWLGIYGEKRVTPNEDWKEKFQEDIPLFLGQSLNAGTYQFEIVDETETSLLVYWAIDNVGDGYYRIFRTSSVSCTLMVMCQNETEEELESWSTLFNGVSEEEVLDLF